MKVIETNTGRNTIEDLENEKVLVVQRISIEPRTGDYMMFEFRFERGEKYAKLTHKKDERQEEIILWSYFIDTREFDELVAKVKQIASIGNEIDRQAEISRFVTYIYEKYHKPDP